MSEQPGPSEEKNVDPRLLTSGVGCEQDLQELVKSAQELRKTMSSGKVQKGSSSKGKSPSHPNISPELVTKVDSILAIVQNLQSNQREMYNYIRAMAPRYSVVKTEGPVEHFEAVNQTNRDTENAYLTQLRQSLKKTKEY